MQNSSPAWQPPHTINFQGELENALVYFIKLRSCNVLALSRDDGLEDIISMLVVPYWQSPDGRTVLQNGNLPQPICWCLRRGEIVVVYPVEAILSNVLR